MNLRSAALGLTVASVLAGGCAHLSSSDGGVAPIPTASPSAGPSGTACQETAAANAQIIAISPLITPTAAPTYGVIAGYGLVTSGGSSNVASPVVLTSNQSVQFFDDDQVGSQLQYSAVGIPGVSAFPSPSFTFPASAAAPIGTQIEATSTWSTGLLAGQCYSQTFTLKGPGTYFFGDYTYYGLGNLRDVIVVDTPPPS